MIGYSTLKVTLISTITLIIVACGSAPKYACKAAVGLGCISVRGVYDKVNSGELDRKESSKLKSHQQSPMKGSDINPQGTLVNASAPMYVAPKVMRIWIGPWADKNGVYHSQSYVYKVVSKGRWLNQPGEQLPESSPAIYSSSIHGKKP